MKKTMILALTLISILSLPVTFSYADDDAAEPPIPAPQAPPVQPPPVQPVQAVEPVRITPQPIQVLPKLVNLGTAQNQDQIRDLEKRIDDLEREGRSQDERMRSLERTVNDLRRAR